jgi:hypothetical protein
MQTQTHLRLKEKIKYFLKYTYSDVLIMSLLWAKRDQDTSITDIQNAITEAKNEMIADNNLFTL